MSIVRNGRPSLVAGAVPGKVRVRRFRERRAKEALAYDVARSFPLVKPGLTESTWRSVLSHLSPSTRSGLISLIERYSSSSNENQVSVTPRRVTASTKSFEVDPRQVTLDQAIRRSKRAGRTPARRTRPAHQ